MKLCAAANLFDSELDTFISQYENMLNDDTLSEVDSADITETLDKLYAYKTAIKQQDLEYINAQGRHEVDDEHKKSILEDLFINTYGKYFTFTKNTSKRLRTGYLKSIDQVGSYIKIVFQENNKDTYYTFSMTSNGRSTDKSKNDHINLQNFQDFVGQYNIDLSKYEKERLVLGNSGGKFKLNDKYKVDEYVHGNAKHMKDMLKRLHLLGKEKASDEDLDTYIEYIDRMSPTFFNNLELYINEKGNNSEGITRSNRIDIIVKPAEKYIGNQQSEASIFMEEVIHSMTASAMHSNTIKSNKLKRQLANLIEQARKSIVWQDFLPSEEDSLDKEAEERYAKWLYAYIFNNENADYEFIAKGLTVPEVSKAFSKVKVRENNKSSSLLDKINDFFGFILDVLSGNLTIKQKSQNVHEALVNLAFSFGEINNRYTRKLEEKGGYLDKVMDVINSFDDNAKIFTKSLSNRAFKSLEQGSPTDSGSSLYDRVKNVAKFITGSLVNPIYTKNMGVLASSYGIRPESTIREIIGGLFASDSAQKVAEFLSMQSGYVDKQRNDQIDLVRKNILHKFTNQGKVSEALEKAITSVIADTRLSYLFGNDSITKDLNTRKTTFTNKTLRKLLTDENYLDKLIDATKKALKEIDGKHYYWHVNQSTGLGIYMAKHVVTPAQNLNAHNIATGLHSSHTKNATDALEKAINELATLVAIKNTNQEEKLLIAEAMKDNWGAIQHIADVIEGFDKNTDETVFKGSKINKIKGYTKELFDDSIIMEIAPLEDKEKMEAEGFKLKSKLRDRAGEVRIKQMALYVTDSGTRPSRVRGAARFNTIKSKGTTITDITFKDKGNFSTSATMKRANTEILHIKQLADEQAKAMESGNYDFSNAVRGLAPVLDDYGNVIDYRYMMDKDTKKGILKQDTRISEVMARSFGSLLDKDRSEKHNLEVLKSLKEDMLANWSSGSKGNDGLTEYALIGPKSSDPKMRELFYMLPNEFKEFIKNRADKTLAVRRDLLYTYFGYSDMTIANFPMLKKVTPKVMLRFLKIAEKMWIEMIKVVKTNILVKMPTVLIGNIVSNMLQSFVRGYNPFKVAKLYVESYRDIKDYNNNTRRLQDLENRKREIIVAINRGALTETRRKKLSIELKRVSGEMSAINRRIKNSNIDELVKLGLDQNVEDSANDSERSSNKLVNFIENNVLDKVPETVKTGLDIIFITRRTKFYKVANEFLEVSDLIARDVQNRMEKEVEIKQANGTRTLPDWWVEEKRKDNSGYLYKKKLVGSERKEFLEKAKKVRHYDLVEDYIAYTKPSGRFEEWLNKVGILMFTKYVKRIQRVISKTGSKNLLKTAIVTLVFGHLFGIPGIFAQSILSKDWYTTSLGAGNIFPIYNLSDHLMNAVTPSIVKSSTYDFSL